MRRRSGCAFRAISAESQGKAASILGAEAAASGSGTRPAGYWQTVTVLTIQPSPFCQSLRRLREQDRASGSSEVQSATGRAAGAATGAARGEGGSSRRRAGCPSAGAASSAVQTAMERASAARGEPACRRTRKARKAESPRSENGQAYVIRSPQFSTVSIPVFGGTSRLPEDPVKTGGKRGVQTLFRGHSCTISSAVTRSKHNSLLPPRPSPGGAAAR